MKFRNFFLTFVGISSLSFYGCIATRDDISILKTQIASLNKTLQSVQANQASSDQQIQDLSVQLTEANDNLKDFNYKLDQVSSKLDNITSSLSGQETEQYKSSPSELFEQAKKQFDHKNYAEAAEGFNLYIKSAPEGANIEEAYFYLAQSSYELKDYQKAAISAATLIDKYPSSKLTAQSRILYAKSIWPLNKKDEALMYLKSVVQDFKNTDFSKEAKDLLKNLK
ncbi:MAG: tetratricopeptide repeat protein [Elusimicrobiaceae bacterium]|nr:tetratricopeptide repeat protein [Elusimicrobiaceae bacterium]